MFRNAVEHGGEDIAVAVADLSAGYYVEDDGSGVPSELRARVFERGVSGSEQGSGLGLFIVKQVADAHGWDVSMIDVRLATRDSNLLVSNSVDDRGAASSYGEHFISEFQ